MDIEKMRGDFEAWYAEERAKQRPYSTANLKDICFQAWIASRAAMVTELPKSDSARNVEVIKAAGRHIVRQGLKVKL